MQNPSIRHSSFVIRHSAAAALLTLAAAASAQLIPTTEPAATAPATEPATEPTTASSTQPATAPTTRSAFSTTRPATTLSTKVKFNFIDAPLDSVVNYLSESFGFTIIKKVRLEGRITFTRQTPVNADEAVGILDSILKDYGYGVIRTGMVLRVDTRANLKKLTPVHVGNDPAEIEDTDEVITQVIPLSLVDAVRLRQDLASMFSPEADVAANTASNTLIITDTSANIRRIVKVVSAMDKQLSTASELRVFKLKYANAAAAAKLITDIFKPDTGTSTQGQTGRLGIMLGGFGGFGGRGGGGPGGPGGGANAQSNTRAGKVTASSDDRTNTVVVTGPKETLDIIDRDIIQKLDSDPAQDTTFFVYALKNANAANLQGVLNGFFGSGTGGSTSAAASSRQTSGFQPLGTSSTGAGSRSTSLTSSTPSRSTSSSSSSSLGGSRSGTTGTTGVSSAATDLQGTAYVVAEPDTNALLVTVKTLYRDRVLELIKALDRDIPQVLIKVLVCEVTHTNSSDIGFEYSILNNRQVNTVTPTGSTVTTGAGASSTVTNTITSTNGGQSGGSDFGLAKAISTAVGSGTPNGLVASVVESNIAATLKALATTGKLDVLSRPSILASDNQLASIMVGQLVPIITSSTISDTGTIINTPTYQQVGIILNVTPHINPDGLVILDVQPTISQLDSQTVTIQAGVNVPLIDQRAAQSRVEIRNGQTIIIGGLMTDQNSETTDKIPLLGDIPWVGALFSHTTKSKTKTELLIFITPQVAQSPDQLPAMSKDEQRGTQLIPNAVAPGTFDQHLQGMQRGAAKPMPPTPGLYPLPPALPPEPETQPAPLPPAPPSRPNP